MAEDAAVRARLQKSGMGALAPAAGMQALAATLATSGPAPAVLSAAPIRWEVLLRGKAIPPFFAEVAPPRPMAMTPFKVSMYASPLALQAARSVRAISGGVACSLCTVLPSRDIVKYCRGFHTETKSSAQAHTRVTQRSARGGQMWRRKQRKPLPHAAVQASTGRGRPDTLQEVGACPTKAPICPLSNQLEAVNS